jgi:6,7-dimethyl-8-ribityllumazine synthase
MSQYNTTLLDTATLQHLTHPRVAIVYTEWNESIVSRLVSGAEKIAATFSATIVEKIAVPGSFELPFACKQLWEHYEGKDNSPEAIIAFGVVMRGGTPHFDYVCKAVTDGIVQLNLTLPIPTIFGVLTLDTQQQAEERLGGAHGHKGEEAMITALKMINYSRKFYNEKFKK